MRARYLLSLALLLCLAVTPTAVARDNAAPGREEAACVPPGDADAANVSEEDVCQTGESPQTEEGTGNGDGTADPCHPAPAQGGDDPAGDTGGPAGDEDPADANEPGDANGAAADTDDEAEDAGFGPDLPLESVREYRDFCEAPAFDQGFLRRIWRFGGDATSFEDGVLTMIIGSAPRVPARFREQANRLIGLEVAVLVGRRTNLVSSRSARRARRAGRRSGNRRVSRRALSRAGRVRVEGKLLAPSRWREDANAQRIPTIRATKITLGG